MSGTYLDDGDEAAAQARDAESPEDPRHAVYRQVQSEVSEVLRDCRHWLEVADAEVMVILARRDA